MSGERDERDVLIEQLRTALDVLLHETTYKDHPEASEMAIAALKKSGVDVRERG
jgi:hypothetical protein